MPEIEEDAIWSMGSCGLPASNRSSQPGLIDEMLPSLTGKVLNHVIGEGLVM